MKDNFELSLSLLVVFFLTLVFIIYEFVTTPSGGHPFGHFLGILGGLLMLMTETVYSARKRWGLFKFGQVRHWLSFHIFTGIVGPFLVLGHTSLEFRGLAGLTMLLTVIVVGSGFLGRYIYTAVPRTLAGIEVDRRTLERRASEQHRELTQWATGKSAEVQMLIQQELSFVDSSKDRSPLDTLLYRLQEWRHRQKVRSAIKKLEKEEADRMAEIERMLKRQQILQRQISSLRSVRKMMGWWHTFHVPLGLTLFTAMFIHIFATIYYRAG
jgi:hypothetical protein